MAIFLSAVCFLILGYIVYGSIVEKILKTSSSRKTPAVALQDGVDYMPLPPYKVFLIQFLNIAGLGPVFGAILGALYGPVCLLWIVLGSIFAGGVHDFLSGFISMRYKGKTMVFLMEKFFGKAWRFVFLILLTLLLIIVGSIFAQTPAHMLADMTQTPFLGWLGVIFGYYLLATLLPIDKIIGKFYPLFALCLIISTVLLVGVLFINNWDLYPELTISNIHPKKLPMFPLMFITIACGAISGFHATQSPLMARCLSNEKYARPIFYGAMILEGFIALVWATLAISFYHGSDALSLAIDAGGAGKVVSDISNGLLGKSAGMLTILSVVLLTITSGDTALRSARLSCADFLNLDQSSFIKRLSLTLVVLGSAVVLSFIDLSAIWLYFGFTNQLIACFMLWIGTLYLKKKKRLYWISLIPALFMTAVCGTYFAYAKILLNQDIRFARIFGVIIAVIAGVCFLTLSKKQKQAKNPKSRCKKR